MARSKRKKRVVVAMSGGVDSSVAALLMKGRGYEVIGVFLKCWSDSKNSLGECSWKDERRVAFDICNKIGIPLITVDAEKEYRRFVVDEMFKDYKKGITPNPDVLCNEVVKFPFLLRAAKKFHADLVVTGHFARIKKKFGRRYNLYRGLDEGKDQSYFLYRLKEEDLDKILFPIGEYTKSRVRKIARKNGFSNYSKKSTVGICFIGKTDMKGFLKKRIKPKKGDVLDEKGNVIGRHDGVFYYTIGQRLGDDFDLVTIKSKDEKQNMRRWYVAKKDVAKNILVVAPAGSDVLYRKELLIRDFHLISDDLDNFRKKVFKKSFKVYARIRHVGELISSKISFADGKFKLVLGRRLDGVSDGQAVVLYKGKRVLGGGVISS